MNVFLQALTVGERKLEVKIIVSAESDANSL